MAKTLNDRDLIIVELNYEEVDQYGQTARKLRTDPDVQNLKKISSTLDPYTDPFIRSEIIHPGKRCQYDVFTFTRKSLPDQKFVVATTFINDDDEGTPFLNEETVEIKLKKQAQCSIDDISEMILGYAAQG